MYSKISLSIPQNHLNKYNNILAVSSDLNHAKILDHILWSKYYNIIESKDIYLNIM